MPSVSISDAATTKEESLSTALCDFNGQEGELSFVVCIISLVLRWLSHIELDQGWLSMAFGNGSGLEYTTQSQAL